MRVRCGVVAVLVAPWVLVACGQEEDPGASDECPTVSAEEQAEMDKLLGESGGSDPAGSDEIDYAMSFTVDCDASASSPRPGGAADCPDVATSDAFAIGRDPDVDVDYDAVMKAIDCDGVVSEREERCLRSPFARVPDVTVFASQVAGSPEAAVQLAAGEATLIERVLSRTRDKARVAVQLDGDPGVYDVQRVRGGWLVVAGEGCASGAHISRPDEEGGGEEISEECQRAIDDATPDEDVESVVICAG